MTVVSKSVTEPNAVVLAVLIVFVFIFVLKSVNTVTKTKPTLLLCLALLDSKILFVLTSRGGLAYG